MFPSGLSAGIAGKVILLALSGDKIKGRKPHTEEFCMKKNVFSHIGIAVLVTVIGLSFSFQACAGMTAATDKGGKPGLVVFQSDFGLEDGAVAEMKGVAVAFPPR